MGTGLLAPLLMPRHASAGSAPKYLFNPARGLSKAVKVGRCTAEPSSTLLWWKIGFGISLAGVVALTLVVILLLSLPATPSEICILLPKDPITAVVNQTVLIPVEVEVPKSDWDFIEIQWHHTKGTPHDFILKFDLRSCNANSNPHKWWERSCILFLEVMPTHRWKKSVMTNGWLVIWNVQKNDAGRYQITVRSNNLRDACSFLELAVADGKKQWSHVDIWYS
ncbi:Carcinoembryonic antigen-related cell adhesion molecule 3 [Varanus komodoensis]|nr:Carcinoembryonic antigen-related cell adhesion molecule 3 [Varanus komodoensis]